MDRSRIELRGWPSIAQHALARVDPERVVSADRTKARLPAPFELARFRIVALARGVAAGGAAILVSPGSSRATSAGRVLHFDRARRFFGEDERRFVTRSSGVMVALVQFPVKSGFPSAVRGIADDEVVRRPLGGTCAAVDTMASDAAVRTSSNRVMSAGPLA